MKLTSNGVPPSALVRNRIKALLLSANTFTMNGYIYVSRRQNKELFSKLDRYGFFKFHRSNKFKNLVAVHQIVLYIHLGWKRYYYGQTYCCKNTLEIHHLDSDTQNNQIDNLWYVTPTENKVLATTVEYCTKHQQSLYNGSGLFEPNKINMFRDTSKSFLRLTLETLTATSKRLNAQYNDAINLLHEFLTLVPYQLFRLIKRELFTLQTAC